METNDASPQRVTNADFQWRCAGCGRVLGVGVQDRLYLSAGGGQYAVTLPVEAVCRRCDTYNQTQFFVHR